MNLSSQVSKYPGKIDVFRPIAPLVVRDRAAYWSARLTGQPYGYRDILRAVTKRIDFLQALGIVSIDRHDTTLSTWDTPRDCSRHTLWCYRKSAWDTIDKFELLPRTNEELVEPSHLATTPAMELIAHGLTHVMDLTGERGSHVV